MTLIDLRRAIKESALLPVRFVRRLRALQTVKELEASEPPQLACIGAAIREWLSDDFSAEEEAMLSKIERRRDSLLDNQAPMDVIDYGAGSPSTKRTAEEMRDGVPSVIPVAQICRASKPRRWARLLFKLIRKLEPTAGVELGSAVGISAAYQASAMRMNGKGAFFTLEGSPRIAEVAEQTLSMFDLNNASVVVGPFHQTLETTLQTAQPVGFFFNDGHHDHAAVLRNHETAVPYLARNAVIVFDDIAWSAGMRAAWKEIQEQVQISIDLGAMGVAVVGEPTAPRQSIRMPL